MEAIILAGGKGTRLKSLLPDVPKPLAPVLNRPFLHHVMSYWCKQGITRFVVSTGYKKEYFPFLLGNSHQACPIVYSVENDPLGTGGGLLKALRHIEGEFLLVLNGDTIFEALLPEIQFWMRRRDSDAVFVLRELHNTSRFGVVELDEDGWIKSFSASSQNQTAYINGGVYLFKKSALQAIAETWDEQFISLENDIFPRLVEAQKIYGFVSDARFLDIGVPEDYMKAEEFFAYA